MLKNSILYSGVQALQKAVGFLLLPVYTTYMATHDYGIVSVAVTFQAFLSILFTLSLHGAGQRFEYLYETEEERRVLWGTLLLFITGNSLLLAALLFLFHEWLLDPFAKGIPFEPYLSLMLASLALSPTYLLYQTFLTTKQRGQAYALNALAYFALNLGLTLLLVVGLRMVRRATCWPGPSRTPCSSSRRSSRSSRTFGSASTRAASGSASATRSRSCLTRSPRGSSVSSTVSFSTTIAAPPPSVSSSSASRSRGSSTCSPESFNQAYSPWFFEQMSKGAEGTAAVVRRAGWLAAFYAAVGLVLTLFTPELLQWMVAAPYRGAWKVIPFLAFSYVLSGLYYIFVNPLFLRSTPSVSLVSGVSGVLGVLLKFLLVPNHGMLGAALANMGASAVMTLMAFVVMRRREPIAFPAVAMTAVTSIAFAASLAVFLQDRVATVPLVLLKLALSAAAVGWLLWGSVGWVETRRLLRELTPATGPGIGQ